MSSSAGAEARRTPRVALAALLVGLVAAAWHRMLGLELLGWDSYPMIAAGRVRNLAELLGTFREELMDGRYPLGHYYRPVAHLAFALDHGLWGLEPRGYHLSDLILLALSSIACAALARRVLGGGHLALLGAAVAGALYALHPVHFEILPAPPRRAEALAVLFTLLALHAQLGAAPAMASAGRRWLVALLCLLAVGSKETGAISTAVVACAAWLASGSARGGSPDWAPRIAASARALWPTALLFTLYLLARRSVLGGLGGTSTTTLAPDAHKLLALVPVQLQALLVPESPLGEVGMARELALGLAAALALLLALGARRLRPGPGSFLDVPAFALLMLLWLGLLVALTGLSGVERTWYSLPFLPLLALALGILAAAGAEAWRARAFVLGASTLTSVALVTALTVSAGGLCARAPELLAASEQARAFLDAFDGAVEQARPGERVVVPGLPVERMPRTSHGERRKVVMLAPYSVEAYAELRHPQRPVRVLGGGGGPRRDSIVVELAP